jgi:hypothetical protein
LPVKGDVPLFEKINEEPEDFNFDSASEAENIKYDKGLP